MTALQDRSEPGVLLDDLLLQSWIIAMRAERKSPRLIDIHTTLARRYTQWCQAMNIPPRFDRRGVQTILAAGTEPSLAGNTLRTLPGPAAAGELVARRGRDSRDGHGRAEAAAGADRPAGLWRVCCNRSAGVPAARPVASTEPTNRSASDLGGSSRRSGVRGRAKRGTAASSKRTSLARARLRSRRTWPPTPTARWGDGVTAAAFPTAAAFVDALAATGADPRRDRTGPWWSARRIHPGHDDDTPSMRFRNGDRALLVTCSGCQPSSDGKRKWLADVFTAAVDGRPLPPARPSSRGIGSGQPTGKLTAVYPYDDADGNPAARRCRYEAKTFRWQRPMPVDGSTSWVTGLAYTRPQDLPLYRLPQLVAADPAARCGSPRGRREYDRMRWSGCSLPVGWLGTGGLLATGDPPTAEATGVNKDTAALRRRRAPEMSPSGPSPAGSVWRLPPPPSWVPARGGLGGRSKISFGSPRQGAFKVAAWLGHDGPPDGTIIDGRTGRCRVPSSTRSWTPRVSRLNF